MDSLSKNNHSIAKFIRIIELSDNPPASIIEKIRSLEEENRKLMNQKQNLEYELQRETKSEISYEEVYHILSQFSQYIKQVSPEQQKELLHAIISKTTVHPSDKIAKRSIQDIELFFDVSKSPNDVLIYDKAHRIY